MGTFLHLNSFHCYKMTQVAGRPESNKVNDSFTMQSNSNATHWNKMCHENWSYEMYAHGINQSKVINRHCAFHKVRCFTTVLFVIILFKMENTTFFNEEITNYGDLLSCNEIKQFELITGPKVQEDNWHSLPTIVECQAFKYV